MEVTIQSVLPSDSPQGQFRLRVSPDATVSSLLHDLAKEANTSLKPHHCLRSKSRDLLPRESTLSDAGIEDGSFLHWTSEGEQRHVFLCFVMEHLEPFYQRVLVLLL